MAPKLTQDPHSVDEGAREKILELAIGREVRAFRRQQQMTVAELATLTGHMSPKLLLADLAKLQRDVPIYVTHRKPGFEKEVEAELRASGDDRLIFVRDGDVFDLSGQGYPA